MIPLLRKIQKSKSMKTESKSVVARDWGEVGVENDCLMGIGLSFRMVKTF
jgi:hypothetical protein